MKTLPLSCALLLLAGAARAQADATAKAVSPTPASVIEGAASADKAIAARVASIAAYSQTKEITASVAKAMDEIAAAHAELDGIGQRVFGPRPYAAGYEDAILKAVSRAEDAASRAVPDGHELAHDYYAVVPGLIAKDPAGPVAEGDASMDVAIANMQRSVVELNKEAARLLGRCMELGERELGYRDIRPVAARGDQSPASWEQVKKRVENEKDAASLKEKAVFAQPKSELPWNW